ncbi:SpoIIE family protein phosphatase [Candidatus Riflebacteria bacterium]
MAKILVVDDEEKVLEQIEKFISSTHQLFLISNPEEVFRKIQRKNFDLIIVDWKMPQMSGESLCLELKKRKVTKDIPVLMLSSRAQDNEIYSRGLEAGALDFVAKPISKRQLVARINVALKIHRQEQLLINFNKQLEAELAQVGDLQKSFYQTIESNIPGFDYFAYYQACNYASGDYYDVLQMENGDYLFLMADVKGHGASAAVVMSLARVILREHLKKDQPVEDIILYISKIINCYLPDGYFITLVYIIYTPGNDAIQYCNCGHPPVLVGRNNTILKLESSTPPIGLWFEPLQHKPFILEKGDKLLLYTDGLYEHDQFGKPRLFNDLVEFYKKFLKINGEKLVNKLVKNMKPEGKNQLKDDIAVLLLEYIGS